MKNGSCTTDIHRLDVCLKKDSHGADASEDWQRAGAYITDLSVLWRRSNPFKLQKEYGLRRNLEPAKEILDDVNVMVDVRYAGIKEPQVSKMASKGAQNGGLCPVVPGTAKCQG
jgi:hypothetical protein